MHLTRHLLPIALLLAASLSAQDLRVEPPNWWTGMHDTTLQLLVHGAEVGALQVEVEAEGVAVTATHSADSPNYLFVDLAISPNAPAREIELRFTRNGRLVQSHAYPIQARARDPESFAGFTSADAIYLITPDRFANAVPENDSVAGMREGLVDRTAGFARHGGDLRGITDRLDYVADMGFTAVWPSPVLENDMPGWSYHGYAITDYYAVDPRFGTLKDYIDLAEAARERGIKLIMDQVVNHCGSGHWWMEDLPFSDWLNFQDNPEVTNHRRTVHQDPYAAEVDHELMIGGWFVPTMPDLNQRNPFLARYLIQHSIWWVETLGLGGVRQDTYPYPDADFLTEWSCRIMNEYPDFSIVGEEWSYEPAIVAYWQRGKENSDGYRSCLPSVMDFPQQAALIAALQEEEGWDRGLIKLYEALAMDFLYADPLSVMVFAENHDMDRLATQLDGDVAAIKMALTYLATVRGIPQFYYGSEVLLNNDGAPGDHGVIRADMPGGWADDAVSAFSGSGLSAEQREVQAYLRQLLRWRKDQAVIARGRTLHFAPQDGVYVYGRLDDDGGRVAVILNKNTSEVTLPLDRYRELFGSATTGETLDGEVHQLSGGLTVPARAATVLILR